MRLEYACVVTSRTTGYFTPRFSGSLFFCHPSRIEMLNHHRLMKLDIFASSSKRFQKYSPFTLFYEEVDIEPPINAKVVD